MDSLLQICIFCMGLYWCICYIALGYMAMSSTSKNYIDIFVSYMGDMDLLDIVRRLCGL